MIKKLSRRPSVRPISHASRAQFRRLPQAIDEDRALASRSQRAVARARGVVIDAQARVLQFGGNSASTVQGVSPDAGGLLAELLQRLDVVHQRLLMFSANIEMEIDRLEVTRLQIERLTTNRTGATDGQSE